MKKILFFIHFILFTLFTNAAFYSHCTIYSENGEKFTVYLNGEKKNEEPSDRVRIINLTQSYYSIKIIFVDGSINNVERKIFNICDSHGAPVDATFILKKNKKDEMGLHWKSQTVYPGYIETNTPTVVVINGGNQVVQQTTTTTTQEPESNGVKMSFGVPGGNININTGSSSNTATSTQQTTTTVVSSTPTGSATLPCSGTILGEADFNNAVNSIRARSTNEGKLLSAKQIVSNNCLSVVQVKTIVKIFETEEMRLEIAKYAYTYTIDKGNYYKLNDVFTNDASIDELNKSVIK